MKKSRRSAFTIIETVAAFALVGFVLVMVAKVGFTSMKERTRSVAKQTALEHLHNVLETARAIPWEKLNAGWASSLKLPEDWKYVLPDGELDVQVEAEKDMPLVKRVTVLIRWKNVDGQPVETKLVGLFAARESKEKQP